MTTWTTISNAAVAVGAIPSSSTVTALRDNVSAAAESASGAPVNVAGWHPVDKITVGDGKTGLIYDSAVTGTVSSIITPDFIDGYEYRVIAHALNCNAGATVRLNFDAFLETDAAYNRLVYSSDQSSITNRFGYDLEILMPRIPKQTHIVRGIAYAGDTVAIGYDAQSYDGTTQKILRARVAFTSGSITAGKVWVFRRREYASSP